MVSNNVHFFSGPRFYSEGVSHGNNLKFYFKTIKLKKKKRTCISQSLGKNVCQQVHLEAVMVLI